MLTSASQYLFSALDAKAFFRTITIRLPSSWPESCIPKGVLSNDDDQSDVTILPEDGYRGKLWTQQSLGCGRPGDQIYLSYGSLESKDFMLGKVAHDKLISINYFVLICISLFLRCR